MRVYSRRFVDPLGFGKSASRFSAPRLLPDEQRYGLVYLGSMLKICVLEALVRDRGDARLRELIIARQELEESVCAEIDLPDDARIVDLTGDGLVAIGIPTDAVRATDQSLGRAWALALHDHPARPDGLLYPSRLNGDLNLAVFDHALPRLRVRKVQGLMARGRELAAVIDDLKLSQASITQMLGREGRAPPISRPKMISPQDPGSNDLKACGRCVLSVWIAPAVFRARRQGSVLAP